MYTLEKLIKKALMGVNKRKTCFFSPKNQKTHTHARARARKHTMQVMIHFNIMQIIWDQSNICNDVHVINLHQHSVTQWQLQCEECAVS